MTIVHDDREIILLVSARTNVFIEIYIILKIVSKSNIDKI